jgi:protein involved in polysaccharide export with SLBB domain
MKKGVFGIVGVLALMVWAPLLGAFQATQGGQAQPPVAPLSREFAPKPYTVAAGDRILLDFYNLVASDLDMKKVYLVEPDGTIQVKHVGSVLVHGKTTPEIADLVRKALEPRWYPPDVVQVTAVISEERVQRVQVGGQVISPGEKLLRGNQMTVSRAIASANGFTPMAGQEIEIQRVVDGKQVIVPVTRTQLDSGDDPQLIADDVVTVKTGYVFFVSGEVNSPGQKVWAPDMTAGRAVSMSNGMTTKGKWGYIDRPVKGPDGKVLKYIKIKGKDLKAETPILPDDTLHIARKWFG